jgi:hypothetical protein
MSMPDVMTAQQDRCGDLSLPVNPFVSNLYHFGMLLGVADLETEQGYHRGKGWLHNAWLHGEGVVWGLGVEVRADRNEIVVLPGLAIDEHGREMWVDQPMCIDLGAWFAERRPDGLDVTDLAGGDVNFVVHVELAHDSCSDRPVPSISQPCEDASFDTAYSRAVERGRPRLVVPGEPRPVSYPRLRQFFGQIPVTDPLVTEAQDAVSAAAEGDRPAVCLAGFRRLAAADVIDLGPEAGAPAWSPRAGDGAIVLAEVNARLRVDGDGFEVVADESGSPGTTIDELVRPAHVRTRTIQELLCHGTGTSAAPGSGPGAVAPAAARRGGGAGAGTGNVLRAVAGSASIDGATVELSFTEPIAAATVNPDAFAVSVLRSDRWHESTIRRTHLDDTGTIVSLILSGAPRTRPIRVIAHGAGPAPILSETGGVLSGVEGDPLVRAGADAALMIVDPSEED